MRLPAALILLAVAALAQSDAKIPPPEVEQALRARVTEFFQYHVDGTFSKAYNLVAEDTKEYYFATQKVQFKSFKIESVKFADDFTHAEVDLTGQRLWKPRYDFPETVVAVPMHTKWKIEDGKWVWYDDRRTGLGTPMGPSDLNAVGNRQEGAPGAPDLSPEALQKRAAAILNQQPTLDKTELILPLDKVSSEQIVFHNSQPGTIKISLEYAKMPGLTAELDKSDVPAGQNAVIKIHFDPKDARQSPESFTLRLVTEPFNRVLPITIKFAPHQPAL